MATTISQGSERRHDGKETTVTGVRRKSNNFDEQIYFAEFLFVFFLPRSIRHHGRFGRRRSEEGWTNGGGSGGGNNKTKQNPSANEKIIIIIK